jgi:hypothetical protein
VLANRLREGQVDVNDNGLDELARHDSVDCVNPVVNPVDRGGIGNSCGSGSADLFGVSGGTEGLTYRAMAGSEGAHRGRIP